jgi:sulfate transport system ATP-binding protein
VPDGSRTALVHLGGWADRYPAQLPGGQRQRMARALAVQPRVLRLDEPCGALDATVRKELRDWLRRLHDEVHVTTIFVTHDQEEAPANPFVMGFVGPSRLGEAWIRPHDIELLEDGEEGAMQAIIERVARVGFEVRIPGRAGRRDTRPGARDAPAGRRARVARRSDRVAAHAPHEGVRGMMGA